MRMCRNLKCYTGSDMCYDIKTKLKTQLARYEYWQHKNGGRIKSLDIVGNDIFRFFVNLGESAGLRQ